MLRQYRYIIGSDIRQNYSKLPKINPIDIQYYIYYYITVTNINRIVVEISKKREVFSKNLFNTLKFFTKFTLSKLHKI